MSGAPGGFDSQKSSTYRLGFPAPALIRMEVSALVSLILYICLYVSPNFREIQFALWPYFSDGSKKCYRFFHLLSFLLVFRMERWLETLLMDFWANFAVLEKKIPCGHNVKFLLYIDVFDLLIKMLRNAVYLLKILVCTF